jgi:acetyl esterase/lipase
MREATAAAVADVAMRGTSAAARGMKPPLPLAQAPAEVRRTMARVGPVWGRDIPKHVDEVFAAYAPLQRAASRDGVAITRDVAYGADPRQVLDVYAPADAGAPRPVVLFVHGGAFYMGERDRTPEFYSNVPVWFARNGCIGVNVEYRLAPQAAFPEGTRDVAAAVDWAHDCIAAFGGDPARIFLLGHSAGGAHVASYAFDANARGSAQPRIAGQVLVSARVRADVLPENPNAVGVRSYYGADPVALEARSPVTHAAGSSVPTMIAIAQFENPLLDVYAAELAWRMSAAMRRAPRFVRLVRHNHASIVAHFNTDEEILGTEILDFIAEVGAPCAT